MNANLTEPLVVGRPVSINTADFLADAREICETGLFTNNGPFNCKLEIRAAEELAVDNVISVSNATKGLELVLRTLDAKPHGEVILPSYTFIATAHAVIEAGLHPVFCDVDLQTHLITRETVDLVVSERTVAIIGVNLWGLPCEASLCSYAREKGLPIIFDSAHAFGARDEHGTPIGSYGYVSVFSMHATKLFNSFEGGLIATNSKKLAQKLSSMRNFGFTGQDEVSMWGTNAKLSEIHAAFACRQLDSIRSTLLKFHSNAVKYETEFSKHQLQGVQYWNARYLNTGCTHSYICVRIDDNAPFSRDELMHALREHNIYAKRYFFPGIHNTDFYKSISGSPKELPNTEILNKQMLILPTGLYIQDSHVERIVQTIAHIHLNANKLIIPKIDICIDRTATIQRQQYVKAQIEKLRRQMMEYESELTSLMDQIESRAD